MKKQLHNSSYQSKGIGGKIIARSGFFFFSRLPKGLIEMLGHSLGFLAWFYAARDRKVLSQNVLNVYGLSTRSEFAKYFGRQVARHQIVQSLETINGVLSNRLVFDGLDVLKKKLEDQLSKERGLIVITAHLGSWELVGYTVARVLDSLGKGPFNVLAKRPRYKILENFLAMFRERMGTRVLWSDSKVLLKEMLNALKQGTTLGFVMDQKPIGRQGPVVEFFNRSTAFVSGPATLALRTRAPIMAVFCIRTGPFLYRVIAEPLFQGDEDGWNVSSLTQVLSKEIEKYIRIYPEQWTWNYRRWRLSKNGGVTNAEIVH